MTIYVTDAMLGQEITFQSKSTTDTTVWTGVVESTQMTYTAASRVWDIEAYNSEVQKADPTVGDYTTLHYFQVAVSNGSTATTIYTFANEWISTFALIQAQNVIHVDIYSPSTDTTTLLALLQSNGYTATVTGVTTPTSAN